MGGEIDYCKFYSSYNLIKGCSSLSVVAFQVGEEGEVVFWSFLSSFFAPCFHIIIPILEIMSYLGNRNGFGTPF